jgi:hypothetical protein
LSERDYQFAIIDPEGDYREIEGAVVLGGPGRVPAPEEALELLERPDQNCVVNLLGVGLEARPKFFETLLAPLVELRARTGRPHWLVLDEAHHLLPASWSPAAETVPKVTYGIVLITVHPEQVSPAVLASVDLLVAIGNAPHEVLQRFAAALNEPAPTAADVGLGPGEAMAWRRRLRSTPERFRPAAPRQERRRHLRKYAEGQLDPDRSFYFRGPEGRLNLRAQNLMLFLQLADGVDDATWLHHLRGGDYSRWFREAIKDEDLARAAARIEADRGVTPAVSRQAIRAIVEQRYTGSE